MSQKVAYFDFTFNELESNTAKCPNHKKGCEGILIYIETGAIVAVCPKCGFMLQTSRRNGVPVRGYGQYHEEIDMLEEDLRDFWEDEEKLPSIKYTEERK